MEIKTDIQIAQENEMAHISQIAEKAGLAEEYVELYGNYKAKIDSRLLRESSAQLNLDPDFRLMDDGEAGLLRQLTLERVLEDAYQHLDEGNFSVLVDSMSAGRDDRRLREMILDIHGRIQSHPDPARWLREQDAVFQFAGVTDVAQTAWGKLLLEDTRALATFWRGQMMGAVEAMAADPELESAYGDSFRGTVVGLDELIAAIPCGIRKINVDTDIRLAVTRNMKELFAQQPALQNSSSIGGVYALLEEKKSAFDPRVFFPPIMDTVLTGNVPDDDVALLMSRVEAGVKEAVGSLIVNFGSYGKAPLVEQKSLEDMIAFYKK